MAVSGNNSKKSGERSRASRTTASVQNSRSSRSGSTSKKTASVSSSREGRSASNAKKSSKIAEEKTKQAKNRVSDELYDTGAGLSAKASLSDELTLLFTALVCILLILSYFNVCGRAGEIINSFFFGLFGLGAYLFPFLLFGVMAFIVANKGRKLPVVKIVFCFIGFITICSILQIICGGFDPSLGFGDYYLNSNITHESLLQRTYCGFIGGLFVKLLCGNFGVPGGVVILVVLLIACVIIVSGKALISLFTGLIKEKVDEKKAEYDYEIQQEYERLSGSDQDDLMFDEAPKQDFISKIKEQGGFSAGHGKKELKETEFDMSEISSSLAKEVDAASKNPQPLHADPSRKINFSGNFLEEDLPFDSNPGQDMTEIKPAAAEVEPARTGRRQSAVSQPVANSEASGQPLNTKAKPATKEDVAEIEKSIESGEEELEKIKYVKPPIDLLKKNVKSKDGINKNELHATAELMEKTFGSFGVGVKVTDVSCGPTVTRYELHPDQGVKVSRITALSDDIKLSLAASEIRIEAPIPGKSAVGIEVPNKVKTPVLLRDLIETKEFDNFKSKVAFGVGCDISGQPVITDIVKMPHLLIAGATGSGKSVCINTIIMSILYKAEPSEVRLIMIDPKVVELSVYNGIPHLLIPVVTDPQKASAALNWAVMEMTNRYKLFAEVGVRDIAGFNAFVEEQQYLGDETEDSRKCFEKLPQIVIIVDELADLMMCSPKEVEDAICRLAQLARAAGLHLIIATQRPSVNVITGVIKANIPSRIAFAVSSGVDSRTIIDGVGAEDLLGQGDMLFFPTGYPKPVRLQGSFVSDDEVKKVVDFLKENNKKSSYDEMVTQKISESMSEDKAEAPAAKQGRDEYFEEAGRFIIEKEKASIGMLQRMYMIGFNRAARIMDQLAAAGVVGPEEGTKPRRILMTMDEFNAFVQAEKDSQA